MSVRIRNRWRLGAVLDVAMSYAAGQETGGLLGLYDSYRFFLCMRTPQWMDCVQRGVDAHGEPL